LRYHTKRFKIAQIPVPIFHPYFSCKSYPKLAS
jgi:hypothetical protein